MKEAMSAEFIQARKQGIVIRVPGGAFHLSRHFGKELRHSLHWNEQSILMTWNVDESIRPIEQSRLFVDCIYDYGERCDLLAKFECSFQCIHEQNLA